MKFNIATAILAGAISAVELESASNLQLVAASNVELESDSSAEWWNDWKPCQDRWYIDTCTLYQYRDPCDWEHEWKWKCGWVFWHRESEKKEFFISCFDYETLWCTSITDMLF